MILTTITRMHFNSSSAPLHIAYDVFFLIRLTESAKSNCDGTFNIRSMAGKISNMGILNKSRIMMGNHWKSFALFKNTVINSEYNKNIQIILNKYWTKPIQKFPHFQVVDARFFSIGENSTKNNNITQSSTITKNSDDIQTTAKVELPSIHNESKNVSSFNMKKNEAQTSFLTSDQILQNTKEQILALPQALSNLFIKFNTKDKESLSVTGIPKWKSNVQSNITKHSITSRTKHVLTSIITAESNASQYHRIEDLLKHIEQYPDARHHALKEGAVTVLLRAQKKCKDVQVQASIREALAVMGYIEPVPRRGIRILSIDGGGMRGLLVIEMLKKLEQLTGQKVHEMFDYMCGVSTGAILSANLASHKRRSLDEISDLYKDLSTKIFNVGAIRGTSSLVWSHAYYDTALWEQLLMEQFGDEDLIKTSRERTSPKFSAIATIFDNAQVMAYIFRNYTLPPRVESQYMGSHKHKLWEAVRASAAAPTYFEEFKHGEYILSDGGIMVNNPCAVAIHEAKQLWPNVPIQCVISFGTGRTPPSIPGKDGHPKDLAISSWKEKFYKIVASATDTEGVHTMLNDLLPDHVYYRFNPYLTEMVSMDDIRPEKWSQLEQDAQMYIRKNDDKFVHAAIALKQQKHLPQKIIDWVKHKQQLFGFN
ncbi:hypothetical protein PV327_007325 [Microctonus hyperodae]|uniref:PNPLA domain-containing protein n=1 Tax=Microctonus hyperodae TaxID=165561 RepID=A0AA39F6B0_MICHY|nr:hypothetical protein PV327_007325 [Microctonus hyperodae]